MSERKSFIHEFQDESQDGCTSINTDAQLPAKIKLEVEDDGNFWLTANREGWLHLARVCAEMGLGDFKSGYHFHKNSTFQSSEAAPEYSFLRDDESL